MPRSPGIQVRFISSTQSSTFVWSNGLFAKMHRPLHSVASPLFPKVLFSGWFYDFFFISNFQFPGSSWFLRCATPYRFDRLRLFMHWFLFFSFFFLLFPFSPWPFVFLNFSFLFLKWSQLFSFCASKPVISPFSSAEPSATTVHIEKSIIKLKGPIRGDHGEWNRRVSWLHGLFPSSTLRTPQKFNVAVHNPLQIPGVAGSVVEMVVLHVI